MRVNHDVECKRLAIGVWESPQIIPTGMATSRWWKPIQDIRLGTKPLEFSSNLKWPKLLQDLHIQSIFIICRFHICKFSYLIMTVKSRWAECQKFVSPNKYVPSRGERRPHFAFLFHLSYEDDQRMEVLGISTMECRKLQLWGQLDRVWVPTLASVSGMALSKSLNTWELWFHFVK